MSFSIGQPEQTGLDAILGATGSGIAQGLQKSLDNFYETKQRTKQGNAIATALGKPELGDIFSQLGPDLSKLLIDQYGAENLAANLSEIQGLEKKSQLPSALGKPAEVSEEIKETDRETTQGPKESIDLRETVSQPTEEERFREIYDKTPAKQKPQVLKAFNEQKKIQEQKRTTGLKDTAKLRQEYANDAKSAQRSIQSKEQLKKLIEKGDLSNPLVAGIAHLLPKGFREGLLSNDSLQYEAGLFDEFGVLKGMFPGQIRTAEITLLEPKLASLFKNDAAKKQILDAGIDAAHAAIIRGKAAAQIEKESPSLSLLEFEDEVEKRAAPDLKKLWDKVNGELNSIADKYSPIVNVYDSNGKIVGTVNKNEAKTLPEGFSIR